MEIEKKYLVKSLPADLDIYKSTLIEQAYICTKPTLRIRRRDDDYIFTFKERIEDASKELCVANEVETTLDRETYERLKKKADGRIITKRRYLIPYQGYTIELDVFLGDYEGLHLAEVEFPSVEEGENFTPPKWFGEDVSGRVEYTNSYLAMKNP